MLCGYGLSCGSWSASQLKTSISFAGCFTQYFFAIFLAATVLSSGCHVPCSLCNHCEQQNLYPAGSLLLAVWLIVILCIEQTESLSLYLWAPWGTLLFRHSLIEKIVFLVASVTLMVTPVLVILSYTSSSGLFCSSPLPIKKQKSFPLVLPTWLSSPSPMETVSSFMLSPQQKKGTH